MALSPEHPLEAHSSGTIALQQGTESKLGRSSILRFVPCMRYVDIVGELFTERSRWLPPEGTTCSYTFQMQRLREHLRHGG
jgi:hypothetical protein